MTIKELHMIMAAARKDSKPAAVVLGISLLDHVIVADGGFVSLREGGKL